MNEIEEVREEIEHDASKIFNAHCMVGGGWVAFIVSYFPPAPFDLAIGLPGLLAFVGGSVVSCAYLFADGWDDAEGLDRVTLHGRVRSFRKVLHRLEEKNGTPSDAV